MKSNQNSLKMEELLAALQQQHEVIDGLMQRDIQGRRILWELVQQMGGSAKIPTRPTPSLWRIDFSQTPDQQEITIKSSVLQDPTKEQLDLIADYMRGTNADLLVAMEKTMLKDYPPAAIEAILAKDHLVWDQTAQKWIDAEVARRITASSAKDPSQN